MMMVMMMVKMTMMMIIITQHCSTCGPEWSARVFRSELFHADMPKEIADAMVVRSPSPT